jgi:hypothetical protein
VWPRSRTVATRARATGRSAAGTESKSDSPSNSAGAQPLSSPARSFTSATRNSESYTMIASEALSIRRRYSASLARVADSLAWRATAVASRFATVWRNATSVAVKVRRRVESTPSTPCGAAGSPITQVIPLTTWGSRTRAGVSKRRSVARSSATTGSRTTAGVAGVGGPSGPPGPPPHPPVGPAVAGAQP